MRISWKFTALSAAVLASTSLITGCSVTPVAQSTSNPLQPTTPAAAPAFHGVVKGGQWRIKGAQIYLLAASRIASPVSPDTGYGDRSTSLISTSANTDTNPMDPTFNWHYVLTDSNGMFTIPDGTWSCNSGDQVYLYSLSGATIDANSQNTAAGQIALLGECGASNSLPIVQGTIQMNEITTVAAAYALAGFAKDATHISSPDFPSQGYLGIENAVKNAALLADINTGDIPQSPPPGVVLPSAMIYTLADILANCTNTENSASAGCTLLMGDETYNTVPPTDTASAAINMAKQPGANVADIYSNMLSNQVWSGYIQNGPPTDFAIGIGYYGGGLTAPTAIAVDADGNAWMTDTPNGGTTGAVIILGPQGAALSPYSTTNGYTCNPDINSPSAIALGPSIAIPQTAWVLSTSGKTVTGVPNGGGTCTVVKSPEDSTDPTGWSIPLSLAAANSGLYVLDQGQNDLDQFDLSNGSGASASQHWQGIFINPDVVALDSTGDIWVADSTSLGNTANLYAINSTGQYTALAGAPFGPNPDAMVVGANQSLWVADQGADKAFPFSTSVTINSASAAEGTPFADPTGGIGDPLAVAVDGIGNAWVLNLTGADIAQLSADGTTALSPDPNANSTYGGYSGNGIFMPSCSAPTGLAVDPSGNVWVSVGIGICDPLSTAVLPVVEFIGMGAPTVTPIADAVSNNKIAKLP